jgi:HlyD family secretion protein
MKNAVLQSSVEGNALIIFIAKEGTSVKSGDLVCELDSSRLINDATQQEIVVGRAQTSLVQGEEDVKTQELTNQSETEAALSKLELAEIDLKKFIEGDLVQQKEELVSQIMLADQNLSRTQESYEYVKRLSKSGYKTQNDLEAERIAVETAKVDKQNFERKLALLLEYTQKRMLIELNAKVDECKREKERTESRTKSAMLQKQFELKARKLVFDVETNKFNRLKKQIDSCKIYATQDGQVVYANTKDGRSQEQVTIDEGVLVRERQAIINLPDLDHMKVNARIHESRVNLVAVGMTAQIKVDAETGHMFNGIVDQVASVPSSTGGFGNTSKEYEAVVRIIDDSMKEHKLRPGLNATTEILVERRDDVLQIPLIANITIGTKQFVYVVKDNTVEVRKIKTGKANSNFIEILEGVDEGEEVVLNPRHQFEKQLAELEAKEAIEQAKEAAKEAAKAPLLSPGSPSSGSQQPAAPSNRANPATTGDKPTEGGLARSERGGGAGGGRRERGGGEGGGSGNFDPMERFNRMDKDQDGKITKAEAEGSRMADRFDMIDTDADGNVTKDEFLTSMARFRGGGGPRPAEAGGN